MKAWLIGLVARVRVRVHAKLLAVFLAIVVLLIIVGAVGLQTQELLGNVLGRLANARRLQEAKPRRLRRRLGGGRRCA
jgi:hypothetical protein